VARIKAPLKAAYDDSGRELADGLCIGHTSIEFYQATFRSWYEKSMKSSRMHFAHSSGTVSRKGACALRLGGLIEASRTASG
jgi:hypothetical protein